MIRFISVPRRDPAEIAQATRDENPHDRDRNEHLPAQPHDLVIAVARIHRNAVANTNTLTASHHQPGCDSQPRCQPWNGLSQPPRNRIGARNDTRIMLAYSARKNSAKAEPEYSTWKPATISDSPSATSNGRRLVSATPEMKYTKNIGNSGSQNQSNRPLCPACAATIALKFRLPARISTHTSAMPIAIS